MRLDYWFFQGYLLGMGSLVEREKVSFQAIRLAVSFNAPMEVFLDGEHHVCTLAAFDSALSHRIDGREGWQFFGYLHPESKLGTLVKEKIAETRLGRIIYEKSLTQRTPVNPGLNDVPEAYQVRELWELLLNRLLGIKTYSLGWSGELKEMMDAVMGFPPAELSVGALAERLNRPPRELEASFFSLAGLRLVPFLFHLKLARASRMVKEGEDMERALRRSGLAGVSSASAYMRNLYGLDLASLLEETPHIRFFTARDSEQLSGHVL